MVIKSKLVEIKTKPTILSVADFIEKVSDEQKRNDCLHLLQLMKEATGDEPVLWSSSVIGFGNRRYKSATTGREVDWLKIGFSPRKANLALYLSVSIMDYADALKKLGKYKTGVGCLYINKLDDVNLNVLKDIIECAIVDSNK